MLAHAGQVARQALLEAIAGQPVKCEVQTVDKYDRKVAICYANSGSGTDLGRTLVSKGVAVAYR
jgi:endonuclease YncB( thermonuclease family)